MKPLVDMDIVVYQAAFGGEMKNDEGEVEIFNFDYVSALIDKSIADICLAVGATEEPILYLTGSNNFRNDIATVKPYKGNRQKPKPYHYKNARAYIMSLPNAVMVEGMEADDAIVTAQMDEMKEHGTRLRLSDGSYTLLDWEDYLTYKKFNWSFHYKGYAVREIGGSQNPEEREYFSLHRVIMGSPESFVVDHINGNTLDNRKINLRVCSFKDNTRNRKPHAGSSSQYKGVGWHKHSGKWAASIRVDNKLISLGYYHIEKEAAEAYDKAALEHFGEFARLNLTECFIQSMKETVICSRDKDLRMMMGNSYSWEFHLQPEFELQWIDEFGSLTFNEEKGELKGVGIIFFYAQLIMGDPVDCIPGIPRKGAKAAFEALKECGSEAEAFEAVRELYIGKYEDEWKERMLEQGRLLWMVREVVDGKPVMWEIPHGR